MKRKSLILIMVLSMILSTFSIAVAAPFDLKNQVDQTKDYSFNQFIDSSAIFDYVANNLDEYLMEDDEGRLFKASEIQAKLDAGASDFYDAIKDLEPVPVDDEDLEVVEVSAINNITVPFGGQLVLPETVTATLDDEEATEVTLDIAWTYDEEYVDTETPGEYTFAYLLSIQEGEELQFVLPGELREGAITVTVQAYVDTVAPVFDYEGETELTVEYGADFVVPVVTATDNVDGEVEVAKVITDAEGNEVETIDTTVAGTYTITYTAVDAAGNEAELVIIVVVGEDPQIAIVAAAEEAIEDYEAAPYTTLEEIEEAESLEAEARKAVDLVIDEDVKANLIARIDAQKALIDPVKEELLVEKELAELEEAGKAAVEALEDATANLKTQDNIDAANELVEKANAAIAALEAFSEGNANITTLSERVELQVAKIAKWQDLVTATVAVEKAEESLLLEDHDDALDLVNAIPDDNYAEIIGERELLRARLVLVNEKIDKIVADVKEAVTSGNQVNLLALLKAKPFTGAENEYIADYLAKLAETTEITTTAQIQKVITDVNAAEESKALEKLFTDADKAVEKVEKDENNDLLFPAIKTEEEQAQFQLDIEAAQAAINKLPEDSEEEGAETPKANLQERLDTVISNYADWIEIVLPIRTLAEANKQLELDKVLVAFEGYNVNNIAKYVEKIAETGKEPIYVSQIEYIIKHQNADIAVTELFKGEVLAEDVDQAAITAAKDLVNAMPDDEEGDTTKADLLDKIENAQDLLDAANAYKAAETAVNALVDEEGNLVADQDAIDKAQELVNKLADGEGKRALQAKIDAAQELLNAANALEKATAAVNALFVDVEAEELELAEGVDKEAINAAQALVTELPNDSSEEGAPTPKKDLQALVDKANDLLAAANEAEKALKIKFNVASDGGTNADVDVNVNNLNNEKRLVTVKGDYLALTEYPANNDTPPATAKWIGLKIKLGEGDDNVFNNAKIKLTLDGNDVREVTLGKLDGQAANEFWYYFVPQAGGNTKTLDFELKDEEGKVIKSDGFTVKFIDEFTAEGALVLMNEAEDAEAMRAAITEMATFNAETLVKYINVSSAEKLEIAKLVLEARPEETGFADVNTAVAAITQGITDRNNYLQSIENFINAVNTAGTISEMKTALDNEDLFPEFFKLRDSEKINVAELVLNALNELKAKDPAEEFETIAEIKAAAGL